MHQRDGLGLQAVGLAGQPVEIETGAPLDRELGHVGSDSAHDLAHETAEHASAYHQDLVTRLDDRQRAGLQRRAARARHDEDLALGLEHLANASVVGSRTVSSKPRSYWMLGGWFMAWITGHGSSVGPGIISTGRVCTWVEFSIGATLVLLSSNVASSYHPEWPARGRGARRMKYRLRA